MNIKGFTLIELLFTLALISLLLFIGSTSFFHWVQRNEQQIIIDEIHSVVEYAKLEAMTKGHPMYLKPSDDSLNWAKGIALIQFNKKSKKMELAYQWQLYHPSWTVMWSGARTSNQITFANNPSNAISNGKFFLTNNSTKKSVVIILNRLGRIRVN